MRLVVLTLVGCGWPTTPSPGTPGASFPHPADYPDHGAEALADADGCTGCHAIGEETRTGPGCQSCHAAYPHEAGIVSGAVHGPAWVDDAERCVDCHGTAGERAPGAVTTATCTSCHHTYPHPVEYEAAHGNAVLVRGGPAACASCHPADRMAPGQCAECHPAYPHRPEWAAASHHRGVIVDGTCTEGCHATAGPLTVSGPPSCTACHDLYPHPEGWTDGHLRAVQARGEAPCQQCHAPGTPVGVPRPVSCGASCHGSTP